MSFEAQKLLLLMVLLSILRFTGASPAAVVTSVEQTVDVQVDAEQAHFAVVIGIEDMFLELILLYDATLRTLLENVILITVGIEHTAVFAVWMTVVFIEGTEAVVLVQHIVHLKLR